MSMVCCWSQLTSFVRLYEAVYVFPMMIVSTNLLLSALYTI